MNDWPWNELGLPGPAELPAIRRAYAERLKTTRPEENPEGFQRLHSAYQAACQLARRRGAIEAETEKEASQSGDGENVSETEPVREWDFERLFAEGAAEERGRRFQKLWASREKNRSRYDAWTPSPSRDPAEAALVWIAVARALSMVEEFASGDAEASLWNLFCKSELFQYVRNQPDFVFALEDLLKEAPDFPETGCRIFFRAYGFDTRPVEREYIALYELLRAHITDEKDGAGSFPRIRFLAILFPLIAVLILNILADSFVLENRRKEWVRDWIEEDFGREFVRAENRDRWKIGTLFDTQTQLYFRARWDGPRETEQGRRGYVTDYTQARMSREIADFAERRDRVIFQQRGDGSLTATREDYLRLPLTGAGEDVSALEDLLSAAREETWYRELPPDYVLYLGWGDWSFYAYHALTDDFDGNALRRYYERFFGPDLCRIALEEIGVATNETGEALLLFTESGTVRLENRQFFHVVGAEKTHLRPRYHYFLSDDGTELFCVPTGGKVSELTLRTLYRMDKTEYQVKGFPDALSVFRDAPETQ